MRPRIATGATPTASRPRRIRVWNVIDLVPPHASARPRPDQWVAREDASLSLAKRVFVKRPKWHIGGGACVTVRVGDGACAGRGSDRILSAGRAFTSPTLPRRDRVLRSCSRPARASRRAEVLTSNAAPRGRTGERMRVLLVGPDQESNLSLLYLAASLRAAGHE